MKWYKLYKHLFCKGAIQKVRHSRRRGEVSLKKCLTGGGGIVKKVMSLSLSQNVSAYIFLQINFYSYMSHHGTIITTKTTCKKVPSYVSNSVSACRRQIVNKHFRILEQLQNIAWSMQVSFHESPDRVSWLGKWNDVSASLFSLVF